MNKAQKLHEFWSSVEIPAYDENSVPDDVKYPYITYSVVDDSIGNVTSPTASIWYRSSSWAGVEAKKNEVAKRIAEHGFLSLKIDDGYIYLVKGVPFAQRMVDPSDELVKRMYLNLQAEFLTAY